MRSDTTIPDKTGTQKTASEFHMTTPSNPCWPGFEPVPGKPAHSKGSCKPKPGKQTKAVRRADQKAAAASKLKKTNSR